MTRPANTPQRDRAFGLWYGKHGLRPVLRSDRAPQPHERLQAWAARYYPQQIEHRRYS